MGFPCGSAGKESACNVGDLGSIPGLGTSPGEGNSCPLQYSGLENSMDCIIHGVTKSRTRLSILHFHFQPLIMLLFIISKQIPNSEVSNPDITFSNLLFSHSLVLVSDSLRPRGLQCTRFPCPSLSP